MAEFPLIKWEKIDGRRVPFTEPQHYKENEKDVVRTGEKNPLPTKDSGLKTELDLIKQTQKDILDKLNGTIDTHLTGSVFKNGLPVKIENLDILTDNQKEMINVLSTDNTIYGAYWDKLSDPTMVRTDAAEDLVAEVGIDGEIVHNDFDSLPIWGELGEAVDDHGNVFIRIPKFYIRKKVGKNFYSIQISKTQHSGFYLPAVFWDFENDKELEYFDYGKYEASLSDSGSRLESKPNRQLLVEKNIVTFRNYARASGAGYQQNDVHAIDVIQALFTIEFATLDSQSVARGYVSGNYSSSHTAVNDETGTNRVVLSDSNANAYEAGQTLGIGANNYRSQVTGTSRLITEVDRDYDDSNTAIYFDGDPVDISTGDVVANRGALSGFSKDIYASSGSINADDGKNPFVYRGIENPFGNIYEWIDGINILDHQAWVAQNAEDYSSNVFASPYEILGYQNNTANGWATELGYDVEHPYAQLPTAVGGNSSTYYADYYYQNTGQRVVRFGGSWGGGSYAGLFLWSANYTSGTVAAHAGGRLLKKLS